AHRGVVAFGRVDLGAAGLAPHRHVAHVRIALVVGRGVRADPVMVAVLAPVLDHAHPGATGLQRAPEIGEGGRRHVRMADEVVRLAEQLGFAEAAGTHERGVDVDDKAAPVGARDEGFVVLEREFAPGDGEVVAHFDFRGETNPRRRRAAGDLRGLGQAASAATSPIVSWPIRRSMSSRISMRSSSVPMPVRNWRSMVAPISGTARTCSPDRRTTSETLSTTMPTTRPPTLSTIITVSALYSALARRNFRRMSTTGTMMPRRLITPLM